MSQPISDTDNLETTIGQKIAELLFLTVDTNNGRFLTDRGSKTFQGLGAAVIDIVWEETGRISAKQSPPIK